MRILIPIYIYTCAGSGASIDFIFHHIDNQLPFAAQHKDFFVRCAQHMWAERFLLCGPMYDRVQQFI